MERAVDEAVDLRQDPRTEEWRERLGRPPDKEEVIREMRKMRDGAPGEDGTRLNYILKGGDEIIDEVVRLVRYMWENSADSWEDSLKRGVIIPLFKKGDFNDPNNYRGVCLLPMGRRIVARIAATRLKGWAEAMGLLDDNQAGFRKGRSTADATQIMMRIQEDAIDLRKRGGATEEGDLKPTARLLDLTKAYPRVNKPALWRLLERYGLNGDFLRLLIDLHETMEYVVRGREGNSEPWVPARGLTEGCPSSPDLFNIYHQAVMRVAEKERTERAQREGQQAGIVIKWIPGSAFPSEKAWERSNSDAVELVIEKSLFADDTTAVGDKKELEEGIKITKDVMGRWEERNNDGKEEVLEFGTEESGGIRMLGSWMGYKEDVSNRLKRAGMLWYKVKNRLIGSKLSKKKQARVVEACVESALLFDCQVRVWQVGEIKKLQKFIDRAYRYVWSRKTKPPLIQMEEERKRMEDVRKELGVQSLRWKIEKRVLERIGHVMRMADDRMTKAVTLGWMAELERYDKPLGRRRKTVPYWKRLMKEAGLDPTNVATLTKDRKHWRSLVKDRMDHLSKWEESRGHLWQGDEMVRNQCVVESTVFVCGVCSKVCKSKSGLTNHRRRMHEESEKKKVFNCAQCLTEFKKKSELSNHTKVCGGKEASAKGRVRCRCGKEFSKSYFSRHKNQCPVWLGGQPAPTVTPPAP